MKTIARLLLFTVLPAGVSAHHSTAEFDQSTMVIVEGIVTEVSWRNPHVMIQLESAGGGARHYELEGMSVSALRRVGLERQMLEPGDRISAAGFASTRTEGLMLLQTLLMPDGKEVLLRRNAAPQFDEAARRYAQVEFDNAQVAAAREQADGIFRVWTWGRAERGWWFFSGPERFPLTEAGLASLDGYDEYTDNPVLKCIAPGMPSTMGNPYPISFSRDGDDIVYRGEEFDIVRRIHMNAEVPDDIEPSPLGYSVGRWDGETLVVQTTHINSPYFNRVGVRQSAEVTVDETFAVSEDGNRLDWTIAVTDPSTLTEPWRWGAHWNWAPGEEVGSYDCTIHN